MKNSVDYRTFAKYGTIKRISNYMIWEYNTESIGQEYDINGRCYDIYKIDNYYFWDFISW